MRFALLLLWLTVLAPAAHAADWLAWRRVGEATLTWGPFTVYHSQLRTPNGRYDGPQQDRALIITYRRDIDREALVEATRDQWQAQGILQQEPRSEAWLRMLQGIWPDVAPGSQLAFVVSGGEGQFWYRASAAQTAFTPLGPRQSAAFSTRFLAIWLDPRTTYPELRQQLIEVHHETHSDPWPGAADADPRRLQHRGHGVPAAAARPRHLSLFSGANRGVGDGAGSQRQAAAPLPC